MKRTKILAIALSSLMFAGVASAAPPGIIAADKVKTFFCANGTTQIQVTYDILTYGNGNGNKVVITKGVKGIAGPNVGFIDLPIKQTGLDALVGYPLLGDFYVDVVNGSNTPGDYSNPLAYTKCTMPLLN